MLEKELDKLESEGIISKTDKCEWATPIVSVLKKNGDVRICGDYKGTLNQVLEEEYYTLPRVEDMMANLDQGEKFSKIDILQAYVTLPIQQECRHLTTINTHKAIGL
ncbi:polyprotein [Plakobranchus ocellatus]|uniref:Polyprotein n=1 Tax=Plakobranchus ocellatus TaxID=259542 RepID=A0AAV4D0H8_9GAST|nr:polyprotein [Plakobranchus ocellatus]